MRPSSLPRTSSSEALRHSDKRLLPPRGREKEASRRALLDYSSGKVADAASRVPPSSGGCHRQDTKPSKSRTQSRHRAKQTLAPAACSPAHRRVPRRRTRPHSLRREAQAHGDAGRLLGSAGASLKPVEKKGVGDDAPSTKNFVARVSGLRRFQCPCHARRALRLRRTPGAMAGWRGLEAAGARRGWREGGAEGHPSVTENRQSATDDHLPPVHQGMSG